MLPGHGDRTNRRFVYPQFPLVLHPVPYTLSSGLENLQMRAIALRCVAGIVVSSVALAHGQTLPMVKPAPEFTLSIKQVGYGGSDPGIYAVLVAEKNISDEKIWGSGCTGFVDWLNLIVLFDGVRMPDTDAVKRLDKVRQAGGPCGADFWNWKIGPGEEHCGSGPMSMQGAS